MDSPIKSIANKPDDNLAALSTIDGVEADLLAISDRGNQYGQGLFETMIFSDGMVPLWPQHCARMVADASVLGINLSAQSLDNNLMTFINLLKQRDGQASGIVKIIVTAGSGGRGYASPAEMNPRIICQYFPLPENLEKSRRHGIALFQCQYQLPLNPVLAGIKHLNRLDQVLACAELSKEQSRELSREARANYTDGLMYSRDNLLIETTCANIFIKTAYGWITPQLNQAGVRGVMRGLLLEQLFPECGIKIVEGAITKHQLATAKEIFTCSSIRGVLPVTKIHNLGHWPIGAETKMLQSALNDHYDCYPC